MTAEYLEREIARLDTEMRRAWGRLDLPQVVHLSQLSRNALMQWERAYGGANPLKSKYRNGGASSDMRGEKLRKR